MIQQNKKGFSLVEVMLLFTVLAVVLAASVPMISRKSNPVPNKISHGVYRCINTSSGLLEQLYTGTRQVKSGYVGSCSFKVPEASLYRVDLYSAGAGGTKGAIYVPRKDDFRSAVFKSDTNYTDFNFYSDENQMNPIDKPSPVKASGVNTLIRKLTDAEIVYYFKNESMIRSEYTGNAGDGGSAQIKVYNNPIKATCDGYLDAKASAYGDWQTKVDEYTPGKSNFNPDMKDALASQEYNQAELTKWEDILKAAKQNKDAYDKLTSAKNGLTELITKDVVNPNYSGLETKCTKTKFFNDGSEVVDGNLKTYFADLKNAIKPNAQQNMADAAWEKYDTKTYPNEINSYINKKLNEAKNKAKEDAIAEAKKKGITDSKKLEEIGKEAAKQAEKDFDRDKAEEEYRKAHPPKTQDDFSASSYSPGTSDYQEELTKNKSNYSSLLNLIKGRAQDMLNSVNTSLAPLNDAQSSQSFSAQISEANSKISTHKSEYNAAVTKYDNKKKELQEQAKGLKKVYEDVKDRDLPYVLSHKQWGVHQAHDANGMQNTERQLHNFCEGRYGTHGASSDVRFGTSYRTALGKAGGKGKYLRLNYPYTFRGDSNYSVEEYLKSLTKTSSPDSFRVVHCASISNGLASNCGTGSTYNISSSAFNGEKGESTQYEDQRYDSDVYQFKYENSKYKRMVINEDGKDLKPNEKAKYPYVAWDLPSYIKGQPIGTRVDVALMTKAPTGGQRGILYVNEKPETSGTYVHKTFNKQSTTEEIESIFDKKYTYSVDVDESTPGEDAVFMPFYNHRIYDDMNAYAKVDAIKQEDTNQNSPFYKDVRIRINSALWTKTYKIAPGGDPGKSASFIASNLGSDCSFTVPAGGPVYILGGSQVKETLEANLAVTMTCTNKQGREVFKRTLAGGKYNTELYEPPNNKFYWYKGVTKVHFDPDEKTSTDWKPTSIWAKVYRDFMGGYDSYDLSRRYQIGMAGSGTELTDTCVEPKGYFNTKKQYLLKYYNPSSKKIADYNVIMSSGADNVEYDGKKDGYSCYIGSSGSKYQIKDSDKYITMKATSGGGGAVVITW